MKNNRSSILDTIKHTKIPEVELPRIPYFQGLSYDILNYFTDMLYQLGVEVINGENLEDLPPIISHLGYDNQLIFTQFCELPYRKKIKEEKLKDISLSILKGELGVAENGAIWVNDYKLPHRALTCIGEHLIIVLSKKNIVWNMHEAYDNIQPENHGYGVFISGPSKTADIEQSLVKGAHGARSLKVFLYG
ncbi:LutC/YkgG family protein [Flammeovirga sp. MY04]|uniref:LutC/YkgG family protein n=1 Tax=Flammeovirga sp. MY04 TaxID=1191459 RepID=UPI00082569A3|nr:LUD domain-containing protein [Flammeovirga sp. MY04]